MRPLIATSPSWPSLKPGRSMGGTWNDRPSSPPVTSESCDASTLKAYATASVTIAKNIDCTRSENSPIASASATAKTSAPAAPSASAPQPGPIP